MDRGSVAFLLGVAVDSVGAHACCAPCNDGSGADDGRSKQRPYDMALRMWQVRQRQNADERRLQADVRKSIVALA